MARVVADRDRTVAAHAAVAGALGDNAAIGFEEFRDMVELVRSRTFLNGMRLEDGPEIVLVPFADM